MLTAQASIGDWQALYKVGIDSHDSEDWNHSHYKHVNLNVLKFEFIKFTNQEILHHTYLLIEFISTKIWKKRQVLSSNCRVLDQEVYRLHFISPAGDWTTNLTLLNKKLCHVNCILQI